jgi:tungstate transport system substrate-binding protein
LTKETGISVRVLAQGTGQALATAAHGDADVVLVHDPEAEERFIAEGHGVDRRQIACNDFIVVGPRSDPARVAGTRDAVAAFTAIAQTGAPFVSRGDKRGLMRSKSAYGAPPQSTPPKLEAERGTVTSAAVWALH